MTLTVRGKTREHDFVVEDAELKYLEEYWADGLEIYPLVNEIPTWIPGVLVSLWCKVQDFFCRELNNG